MKIISGLAFFIILSLIITGILTTPGCANIVPPLGGPRDTLPPKLVMAVPAGRTLNFKPMKIVFTFDEYIDLKEVRDNLIVSPVPKIDPIVDSKLRTVTVRLKDTLQPNTTYSLNFGKAIRDVNEGNILRNFTYVFSTGSYIDSMTYSGLVLVANTGKTDSSLIVLLHRKLTDSAVVNDRPRYFTRVDSTGHFQFKNLQPGEYAVYAMKDEGGSHRYLSKGQLFAFADSPVDIKENTPPITLYAYAEAAETKSSSKSNSGSGSKGTTSKPSKKEEEKEKRLQFSINLTSNEFDVLDTLRFTFANALKIFDSTKLRFTDGNYNDINPTDYLVQRDTTGKKITIYYSWPTDTKFALIAAKDFAQDSAGRKLLKTDTINFHTKKDIDYGEVRIRIKNLNLAKNPVLQFVLNDAVKYSYPFVGSREFKRQLFPPGEFELRILYDDNKNGVWDQGNFFGKHLQPEKVITLRKKFTVKANWDNDVDVTL